MTEKAREKIFERTWTVERTGWVDEVEQEVGPPDNRRKVLRYQAQFSDNGRPPFLRAWFNDPTPAADFVDKIKTGYDPREERNHGKG